jgi:hypothetical protein
MSNQAMRLSGVAILGSLISACCCEKCPGSTSTNGLPPTPLVAGEYTVCDIGDHAKHDQIDAAHLQVGDKIVIGAIEEATHVTLGNHERDLILSPDKSELEGASDFSHPGSPGNVMKHLVRIKEDKNYQAPADQSLPSCNRNKKIIRVEFCKEGAWGCIENGQHFGDTHAQN